MRKIKMTSLLVIVAMFVCLESFAQTSSSRLPDKNNGLTAAEAAEVNRRRERELIPGQESALRQLGNISSESINNPKEKENLRQIKSNVVAVPATYPENFKTLKEKGKYKFAKLINTKCNSGIIVSADNARNCQNVLQIWGGGSFYSFRNKTNFNDQSEVWSDIQLFDKTFIAGSLSVQGIIADLGDKNIEDVTESSAEVKFLKDFKPQTAPKEFGSQTMAIKSGVTENGIKYSASAPANLNSIYILRSIAYQTQNDMMADNRTDLIVVFKIIGVENDGSLIILWKELDKKNSPRFKE